MTTNSIMNIKATMVWTVAPCTDHYIIGHSEAWGERSSPRGQRTMTTKVKPGWRKTCSWPWTTRRRWWTTICMGTGSIWRVWRVYPQYISGRGMNQSAMTAPTSASVSFRESDLNRLNPCFYLKPKSRSIPNQGYFQRALITANHQQPIHIKTITNPIN